MPRKSAAAVAPPEFVFDQENLVPPSQVPAEHKEAYWTQLVTSLDWLRAACATEEFFPLLREIPKAFWEKRFFVYLYRQWPKVKNSEKDKYIDKYPFPIDESSVKEEHGGGGYLAYLNIDGKEQLKQITFAIDGAPKLKPGQVLVDAAGNPLSTAPPAPTPGQSEATQLMETSSRATERAMDLLSDGAKASIEMVKSQAIAAAQPPNNDVQNALMARIIEKAFAPPAAPVSNPLQDKMMELMVERAFGPREEVEVKETPVEKTLEAIKELSGGMSLADLMKPAARAAAADPVTSWAPIVSTLGSVVGQFLEKLPVIQAQRNEALRLEYNLRVLQQRQPGQPLPELPAAPAPAPQPKPQIVQTPPAQMDPAQLMQSLVHHITAGFRKPPVGEWGEATAAAMDFHFSNGIESMGFADTLGDPAKVRELVAGIPELAELAKDARWKLFEDDVAEYCARRWGPIEDDAQGNVQTIHGEKPPAA